MHTHGPGAAAYSRRTPRRAGPGHWRPLASDHRRTPAAEGLSAPGAAGTTVELGSPQPVPHAIG
eukprot:758625-Hanusia_phi.AAC.3